MNDSPARRPLGRRLIASPALWGSILLLLALWWCLTTEDLGPVPFLLMVSGGWCFGVSFVELTRRMVPPRNGLVLHIVVAVLGGILMYVVTENEVDLSGLSEQVTAVVVILRTAATPAIGWIWLALLWRMTSAARRPSTAAALEPPTWRTAEGGDGRVVEFRAVPMTMRSLTGAIVGMVVVIGVLVVALLIGLDDLVPHFGTRLVIIAVGAGVALPIYLLFATAVRRRARDCVVTFGARELEITTTTVTDRIPYRELDHLLWRGDSDYARIEARGAGAEVSLIVGLAKPPAGLSAGLPELPARVLGPISDAGLVIERSRGGRVVTASRPAVRVPA